MSLTQVPSVVLGISQTKKTRLRLVGVCFKEYVTELNITTTQLDNITTKSNKTVPLLSSGVFKQTMLFFIVNFFQ